jgi:hypothetical protein
MEEPRILLFHFFLSPGEYKLAMKLSQHALVRLGAVVAGIVVLVAVVNAYSGSKFLGEGLEVGGMEPQGPLSNTPNFPTVVAPANAHSEGGNAAPSLAQEDRHPTGQQTYSQTVLSPEELLPKGGLGASWAATNPVGLGDLKGQNFLTPTYHYGINTVGQSLRNANLDVRSDPPNPRAAISPFLNSTIEPDLYRRELEIGESGAGAKPSH